MRPVTRTSRSCSPRHTRPAGTSWFSRCSAAETCAGLMPYARIASGSSCTRICRGVAADHVHAADAGDRLDARRDDLVGEVGELADRPLGALHRDRHDRALVRIEADDDRLVDVGRQLAPDARHLGLHVLLRLHRVDAELNFTRTIELPSNDVEVISWIPCTVLSASSIGRETSRSITSGDAPGYVVCTMTTGYVTSGYSSIASRW